MNEETLQIRNITKAITVNINGPLVINSGKKSIPGFIFSVGQIEIKITFQ
jgi:flagellar assembly factor FliW